MLLPSSIQRAEDLVGMAMPTVGFSCARAGPASTTEPSAMADRVDLSRFMFHSQGVELKSPRCRGFLLAPVRIGASSVYLPHRSTSGLRRLAISINADRTDGCNG